MTEPLNIVKLCVGTGSVEDLMAWQAARYGDGPAKHITRMAPTRRDEVLAGGSLYWVFKGLILARQRVLSLDTFTDDAGIGRCAIGLDRAIILTEAIPKRPFQGWRYLAASETPRDLQPGTRREDPLPRELLAALSELGLR